MDEFDLITALTQLGVDKATAEELKAKIKGGEYMNLVNALNRPGADLSDPIIKSILGKYGINDLSIDASDMNTKTNMDETFGVMTRVAEGFSYAVSVDIHNRDKILDWLDENQVEYQATSPTEYRIDCGDRDSAYRTGRALSKIMRKPVVRDSIVIDESTGINLDWPADAFLNDAFEGMEYVKSSFKDSETASKTSPAGPNTSSFTSTAQGSIEVKKQVTVPGGTYGFTRHFVVFLKIGAAINHKTSSAIKEVFFKFMNNIPELRGITPDSNIVTKDGYTLKFGTVSGSSWGGFGYFISSKPKSEGIEEMSNKKSINRRVQDAKTKIADMSPRNPVVTAAIQRSMTQGGAMKGGVDPRKVDPMGRGAKHKVRYDEAIGFRFGDEVMVGEDRCTIEIPNGPNGTIGVMVNGHLEMVSESEISRLDEGVMGMTKLNPLFRLRELAGLPLDTDDMGISVPEPEMSPDGPLAAGSVGSELVDAEPAMDMDMDMDMDIAGSVDDSDPMAGLDDIDAGDDLGGVPGDLPPVNPEPVMGMDPMVVMPSQSEAMSIIEDSLNGIQTKLAEIRLGEYKSLIQKLQDLTTQVQMMGRDYLGERRKK